MIECEQQTIDNCLCPLCSETEIKNTYYSTRKKTEVRKFITLASDDRLAICTKCGYKIKVNSIKRCKLNDNGGQDERQ